MADADSAVEYTKFVRRTLAALADKIAVGDLEDLPLIVQLHSDLEEMIGEAVGEQVSSGASWASIGKTLGIPASTAQSRWNKETLGRGRVVYGLRVKGEDVYRYVGKTKNLGQRFATHRGNALYPGATNEWIRKYGTANVEAVVLQQCASDAEMARGEREWYDRLLAEGHPLANRAVPSPTHVQGERRLLTADEMQERAEKKDAQIKKDQADRAYAKRHADEVNQRIEEQRKARSAAWWEREVRAGRAFVVSTPSATPAPSA